jgi:hypothetical protein
MIRPARTSSAALALAVAALALIALGCSAGGETKPSTTPSSGSTPGATASTDATPSSSAEDALGRYVQRVLSQGFVPNCDKEKRPDDVGKQCARKLGERGGLVAYALGPTFSPATRILILKPENGDWTLQTIVNIDPNQPQAPGIPWPLAVGAQVVVAGTAPDCLKIREAPGTSSTDSECLPDGTAVTTVAGPVDQDNIEWWQLQDHGWAAGSYLRYPDAAPTPKPTKA